MSDHNHISAKPVTLLQAPVGADYTIRAGKNNTIYLQGMAEGKILGTRDPRTGKVYVPPRGPVPTSGDMMEEVVEVADKGTICTFCIVNVEFPGQILPVPYVGAWILLDGSDIPYMHIVGDVDVSEVRMGLRVEAVWKPHEEWGPTSENILYFRPNGEPDADYETYKEHV